MSEAHALRLKLLAAGYDPTPNVHKACYVEKWTTVEITPEWLDSHTDKEDTGLRFGGKLGLGGIDFDIINQKLSDEVEGTIKLFVGDCPVRRGNKGFLALFRKSGDWPKVNKEVINFTKGNRAGSGLVEKVEFFVGSGCQAGCFGTTDKGNPYVWDDGLHWPIDPDTIPKLTYAEYTALKEHITGLVVAEDYTLLGKDRSAPSSVPGQSKPVERKGEGIPPKELKDIRKKLSKLDASGRWNKSRLEKLPVTKGVTPLHEMGARDCWLAVGAALRWLGEAYNDETTAKQLFFDWSLGELSKTGEAPDNADDMARLEKEWESRDPARVKGTGFITKAYTALTSPMLMADDDSPSASTGATDSEDFSEWGVAAARDDDAVDDDDDPMPHERIVADDAPLMASGVQSTKAMRVHQEFIAEAWILARGYTLLLGPRGVGKTGVAVDLGNRLACDMPWREGVPLPKGYKVIYICGEDLEGVIARIEAWEKIHDIIIPEDRMLIIREPVNLSDPRSYGRLKRYKKYAREWLGDCRNVLVITDTIPRNIVGISASDDQRMSEALSNLEWFSTFFYVDEIGNRIEFGACLGPIHPPKAVKKRVDLTASGSGLIENMSRGIIHVWKEKNTDQIDLVVDRIKGAKAGSYAKIRLEEHKTGQTDKNTGKPATAPVVIAVGGEQFEGTGEKADLMRRENDEKFRQHWAEEIAIALDDGADYELSIRRIVEKLGGEKYRIPPSYIEDEKEREVARFPGQKALHEELPDMYREPCEVRPAKSGLKAGIKRWLQTKEVVTGKQLGYVFAPVPTDLDQVDDEGNPIMPFKPGSNRGLN